jgi:hypothetical protein
MSPQPASQGHAGPGSAAQNCAKVSPPPVLEPPVLEPPVEPEPVEPVPPVLEPDEVDAAELEPLEPLPDDAPELALDDADDEAVVPPLDVDAPEVPDADEVEAAALEAAVPPSGVSPPEVQAAAVRQRTRTPNRLRMPGFKHAAPLGISAFFQGPGRVDRPSPPGPSRCPVGAQLRSDLGARVGRDRGLVAARRLLQH